jgi:hypothetical protein
MQILTTATTGAPSLIEQRIEAVNVSDFVNGTYITVSFWAIQNTPATFITLNVQLGYPSAINTFTTFNSAAAPIGNVLSGSWTYYRATFQINTALVGTNGLFVQFWAAAITAATNIQIAGVQVEKGQVATPFEFRPYGVELQLCQRYFQKINATGGQNFYCGLVGNANGSTCSVVTFKLTTGMRGTPSSYWYTDQSPQMISPTGVTTTLDRVGYNGGTNITIPGLVPAAAAYGVDSPTDTTMITLLPTSTTMSSPGTNYPMNIRNIHVDFISEL